MAGSHVNENTLWWSILSRDTPLILAFATHFSTSNIRHSYYFDPVKSVAKGKINPQSGPGCSKAN